MSDIRYYISGHGLGHASRSCQIINTLRHRHPDLAVEVVSTAPGWFFSGFLDPKVPVRPLALDFGVLQHDSLIMREEETLIAYRRFLPERQRLVDAEAESLRNSGIRLVAADIPAAAFAAAREAGIFSVGISNFTWDWIYRGLAEAHPEYGDVLESLTGDYRQADLLLRLPFHDAKSDIPRVEDQPLVARISALPKDEIRRRLNLSSEARVGLISFGGFGLREFDPAALGQLDDWVFLTENSLPGAPANLRAIPSGRFAYPDLVKAADVVISKPGYGIVSECLANGTACLYTGRGDFREQALLVAGLHRFGRAREISNSDLRSGTWRAPLEALLQQAQPKETLASNGDAVIADRLAQLVVQAGGGRA
ncbi:hypothetical protein [Trichloromonas sp.]|uniref:hypothetical protein n=1 Tax=Trichloromonas sp. TaxID=3069249 RepID=UPI003D815F91